MSAASWLATNGVPVLVTIGLFALIIVFHEFGHFVIAKLARIPVHEFSLGFGRPQLLGLKWRGTRYSLRPVLIGGYVRIAGMEPDEDVPHGFDKKPIWTRLAVIASGSGMNFMLAVVLFIIMGMVYGRAVGHSTRIERVLPGSPAATAGLRAGDRLLYAGPVPVTELGPVVRPAPRPARTMSVDELRGVIIARPEMPLRIVAQRGDRHLSFRVVPTAEKGRDLVRQANGKSKMVFRTVGRIGVVFSTITRPLGFWPSIKAGFIGTYEMTSTLIGALWKTAAGELPAEFGGPLEIADLMTQAARVGWHRVLFLCAVISVNVGVVNLLPVPALDGSRLVFIAVEGIRRRPIDKRKEAIVHLIGFALLLALLALLTYNDLLRLIVKYEG